ncbi:NUDIX hydrolase domain-like protein [Annulohypoxylon moriforme]|nr:NUDIX hydrolase domain-like protein [Annulohypoxylon moriforme]
MDTNKNCGKTHGKLGDHAAGLLIHRYRANGEVEMLFGRKALDTEDGGYWSTIGGAMENGETPQECALREVEEEIGIRAGDLLIPTAMTTDDHEDWGWGYTTIFATPAEGVQIPEFKLKRNEITHTTWVTRRELHKIKLHPGVEYYLCDKLHFLLPPDLDPETGAILPPPPMKVPRREPPLIDTESKGDKKDKEDKEDKDKDKGKGVSYPLK